MGSGTPWVVSTSGLLTGDTGIPREMNNLGAGWGEQSIITLLYK